MFTFPMFVFYFFFLIVFKENKDMLGWCGVAAVVAANMVIVSYVIMAWNEDKGSPDQKQKIQQAPAKQRSD